MRHPINKSIRNNRGVTLVELIVSMVIISIALGGVLMVMNFTVSHSADPMIQHQAVAIAEAYMEEILLQGYFDPDLPAPTVGFDECPVNESDRSLYDNVCDYSGINYSGAKDQKGDDISGLGNYDVSVAVEYDDHMLNGDPAQKIIVTVKHSATGDMSLIGYRTNYQ